MTKVRCAIYTRKSSEEGLEQDFNSLHAQREACAAYILSQASEGWALLPGEYDDGGLSGGTLERPALKHLLADIEAGKLDIVVVYKVDRLTRSLLDFARLVETMDKAGVSFVSVTQSFNTTTSMGRLTLNMLLSFAQFEREVTAERIRDKIAASKAKGMWMGGIPPLGYAPDGRSLKIVDEHAELVRIVFERYIEIGNVRILAEQLEAEGMHVPERILSTGKRIGGGLFTRGHIYKILASPVYLGEVHHKGKVYDGKHPAIIDRATWDGAQGRLQDNTQGPQRTDKIKSRSLLAGKLLSEANEPLIANHACKGKLRYRYYVSRRLHHDPGASDDGGLRMPALELEKAVAAKLAQVVGDPLRLASELAIAPEPEQLQAAFQVAATLSEKVLKRDYATVRSLIDRVHIGSGVVRLTVQTGALTAKLGFPMPTPAHAELELELPYRLSRRGQALRIVKPDGAMGAHTGYDQALINLLLMARCWWKRLEGGSVSVAQLARAEGISSAWITKVIRLQFLAPDLVTMIVNGNQPPQISAAAVTRSGTLPVAWTEQRRFFELN